MNGIFALFGVRLRKNRYLLLFLMLIPIFLLLATGTLHRAASDAELLLLRRNLEVFFPFFAAIPLCVLFNGKEEASLIVLKGGSLIRVALVDSVQCFLAAYISGISVGLFLMPRWMLSYFLLSYPVTLFFLICLALLVRFLFAVRYVNIAVYSFAFLTLYYQGGLSGKTVTKEFCRFDAFLGGYAHGVFSDSSGMWYVLDEMYLRNRIFILAVSLLILTFAWLLSKQKRLYD